MKRILRCFVCVVLMYSPISYAAATLNVTQSGADVVASFSGTINILGVIVVGGVTGNDDGIVLGPESNIVWDGIIRIGRLDGTNGSFKFDSTEVFSTGGTFLASASSGPSVGVGLSNSNTLRNVIYIPQGYVSNTPLSATSTWIGATISAMGLIPGTYVFNWGSGSNADSLTLMISAPPTPIPTMSQWSLILLTLLLGMVGFARLRFSSQP